MTVPRTEGELLVEILVRLDTMVQDVTDWESDFLESMLRQIRQGRTTSPKQRKVLQRMAEQYLGAEAGAEVAGQGRLF